VIIIIYYYFVSKTTTSTKRPFFHARRPHIILLCIRVATIVPSSDEERFKSCQHIIILVYLLLLLLWPAMRLFVWNSHDLRPITSVARVDVLRVYLCVVESFLRLFFSPLFTYLFICCYNNFFLLFFYRGYNHRRNLLYLNVTTDTAVYTKHEFRRHVHIIDTFRTRTRYVTRA